jgi:hypothetical protein
MIGSRRRCNAASSSVLRPARRHAGQNAPILQLGQSGGRLERSTFGRKARADCRCPARPSHQMRFPVLPRARASSRERGSPRRCQLRRPGMGEEAALLPRDDYPGREKWRRPEHPRQLARSRGYRLLLPGLMFGVTLEHTRRGRVLPVLQVRVRPAREVRRSMHGNARVERFQLCCCETRIASDQGPEARTRQMLIGDVA